MSVTSLLTSRSPVRIRPLVETDVAQLVEQEHRKVHFTCCFFPFFKKLRCCRYMLLRVAGSSPAFGASNRSQVRTLMESPGEKLLE